MYQLSAFMRYGLFSVWIILVVTACQSEPQSQAGSPVEYFCGAENKIQSGDHFVFDDGQGTFSAGGKQVSDSVFEGNFAVQLDSLDQYGMPFKFYQVKPGSYFEASVWIKNPVGSATLIAGFAGKSNFTLNTTEVNLSETKNGWSKYFISFGVEAPVDSLTFFLFSSREKHYFDNFEIRHFTQRPPLNDSLKASAMNLYIPDTAMAILDNYKEKALSQSIISDELKEYVHGFIVGSYDSIPVEIRLKGDWTDHLENGKTSYRIKTDLAYNGLTSFSIQHPQTRNYMHEWFMHRLCEMEGLLATTYKFIPVEINGVNQGIYALEEHFDKQIMESRNRREGPILKMDESGFWALLASGKKDSIKSSIPYFESSMITCFKEGRTEKTPVLSEQFQNASTLLTLFKNGYEHPEQIFDLDKTARYYALMDLGNIHHSMAWHNRRYYYNPVTTKLEIIGFDMIPAIPPNNPLIAQRKFEYAYQPGEDEGAMDFYLFTNEEFREKYTHYCYYYNSERFLDSIFGIMQAEISANEKILEAEFPNYRLNKDFYYQRATYNRKNLEQLDSAWDSFMLAVKSQREPKLMQPNYKPLDMNFLVKEISINAYRSEIDSTHFKLQLENFHLNDAEVVGYSTKAGEDTIFMLDEPVKLSAYQGNQADYREIVLPKKPSKIHFKVANIPGAIHSKKVFNWAKPAAIHPRMELASTFKTNSPAYAVKGDTLYIKTGRTEINSLVYVPSKYVVVFEKGANLVMNNQGGLILNNSVYMLGTAEQPITISSEDTSSLGITILSPKEVRAEHVRISNLGMLDYKGWTLTGAFTIYEGEVWMREVEIFNNTCEDALNIIRGNFDIENLYLHHTHGDAFDADFCTGRLSNSRFENTGNDCIDFSGSQVDISKLVIRNSGDKGVSSGEKSTLTIADIDIDGALTAVASKDGSLLTGTRIKALNCEVGAALYRKKPEYPFSKMILTDVTYDQIEKTTLIERGAVLEFNGAKYFGYTTFDIEAMYARFSK